MASHPSPVGMPADGAAAGATHARASGAVLAGGGSRRMGDDKASIEVDGASLLARSQAAVARAVGIATGDVPAIGTPRRADATQDWIADLRPDAGPLAGLESALTAAVTRGADRLLVTGVDHPWLAPEVLALLLDRLAAAPAATDGVVLGTADGPLVLIGVYRTRVLPTVADLLDAGTRRLHSLLDALQLEVLPPSRWRQADPLGASAVDADDAATLAAVRAWHTRAQATAGAGARPAVTDRLVHHLGVLADDHPATLRSGTDHLAVEEPLEIRAAGPEQAPVTLATTLRTPGHEAELAAGWVLAEGLARPEEILGADVGDPLELARPEDTVTVRLSRPVDPEELAHRHTVATASCGVCGRATIAELTDRVPVLPGDPGLGRAPLAWEVLLRLPEDLRLAQPVFRATGGVHATGLYERGGRLVTLREDVGRHNALDAAIGAHLLAGVWPADGLEDLVCVLSGRIGFELVAKAAAARLPILVGVGAASDLAVRTAERLGVTLVGFVREGRATVYTHPGRLAPSPAGG